MRVLRSRLLWLAALTLTVQVAGLAAAPAALCCLPEETSAHQSMDCCKDAGPGHICPLMKKPAAHHDDDRSGAVIRACCSPEDQVFAALFGLMAIPAPVVTAIAGPPVAFVSPDLGEPVPAWHGSIVSPPPRLRWLSA